MPANAQSSRENGRTSSSLGKSEVGSERAFGEKGGKGEVEVDSALFGERGSVDVGDVCGSPSSGEREEDLAVSSVGRRMRMSTKRFWAEVRTRVVVGSEGRSGSQRMESRREMLGGIFLWVLWK